MRKLASLTLLAATCGLAVPAAAMVPSPITLWFSGDRAAVTDKLETACAVMQAQLVQRTDRGLLCQRDVSRNEAISVQTTSNGYAGSPVMNLKFSFREDRGAVRVDTLQYVGVQMPTFYSVNAIQSYRQPKVRRATTDLLVHLGGSEHRPAAPRS